VTGGVPTCPSCSEPIPDPSSNSGSAATARFAIPRVAYAGLGRRAAAYIFDSFLVGIVAGFLILRPLLERAGIPTDNPWILMTGTSRQILAINLLLEMISWLYWAVMESSPWQATLGKRLFGIQVTDLQGKRISMARATARHFGKIILVGFILIPFTARKQAFHDLIARCLVVRKM
jgi:uncharacterized RDD family membrane protein YckC